MVKRVLVAFRCSGSFCVGNGNLTNARISGKEVKILFYQDALVQVVKEFMQELPTYGFNLYWERLFTFLSSYQRDVNTFFVTKQKIMFAQKC